MPVNTTRLGCLIVLVASLLGACAAPPPLPDDGFVDVPGGRVAFRVTGGPDGIPVLMIHGGPGSASCSYPETMKGVAASRPVVTYDQLGSGNSDRMLNLERDAVLSRFVAEVTAIRTQLGLRELHLVGHSWGAAVALEYLLTGDRTGVRSVTFVGPLLSTPRWIEDANSLVAMLPKDAQDAISAAVASGRFDSPDFQAANDVFESEFVVRTPRTERRLPLCASTPVGFNAELYEYMWGPSEFVSTGTLRDYDRLQRLPELDLPVMFLVGEHDEARPATMREYQALVPGSIVRVIEGAAHVSNVDRPDAFNEALTAFMESVEKR